MTVYGHAGAKQLRRPLDAVVGVGAGLSLPDVLRRIVDAATELVAARHGALGVLNADRSLLAEFITVGVTADEIAAIGSLPESTDPAPPNSRPEAAAAPRPPRAPQLIRVSAESPADDVLPGGADLRAW